MTLSFNCRSKAIKAEIISSLGRTQRSIAFGVSRAQSAAENEDSRGEEISHNTLLSGASACVLLLLLLLLLLCCCVCNVGVAVVGMIKIAEAFRCRCRRRLHYHRSVFTSAYTAV